MTREPSRRPSSGTQAPAAISKTPTTDAASRREFPRTAEEGPGTGRSPALAGGIGRAATRGGGEVIELDCGITIYPARSEGGRWRAVWHEGDERQQCEAPTEEKLAAKLEKVKIRLEADAPNMRRPGAALIAHYLDPDRLPVYARWSRKHAHTQLRLCLLYVATSRALETYRGNLRLFDTLIASIRNWESFRPIEHAAGGFTYTDDETVSALSVRFDTLRSEATAPPNRRR